MNVRTNPIMVTGKCNICGVEFSYLLKTKRRLRCPDHRGVSTDPQYQKKYYATYVKGRRTIR